MRKKDSFHDEGYDDRQLIELSLMTPKPPGNGTGKKLEKATGAQRNS